MNGTSKSLSWSARLLIGLVLLILGAATAIWTLAHYQPAARFLGVVPAAAPLTPRPVAVMTGARAAPNGGQSAGDQRLERFENRLAQVEHATERAEGSAGRADALV